MYLLHILGPKSLYRKYFKAQGYLGTWTLRDLLRAELYSARAVGMDPGAVEVARKNAGLELPR